MIKIDILCNDGSPMGIIREDIYGEDDRVGIGGAELALLTLCEQFNREGNSVRLYNNPRKPSQNPYFAQLPVGLFNPQEDRDILIIFRSPHPKSLGAKGFKVWWSCDPHTMGDYRQFAPTVQKIVVISGFHQIIFRNAYGIENTEIIDIPVRISDYQKIVGREEHKVLFSSIPDRGLEYMRTIWPMIQLKVPDAQLVITSDYRLWGAGASNERYRLSFAQMNNVRFLGAIPRERLIDEQLSSQVLAYPCTFEELFCITCAEAQVAGCIPVTSSLGALATTNMWGWAIPGSPKDPFWRHSNFAEKVVNLLENPDEDRRREMIAAATARFDPQRISGIRKERIFT